MMTTGTNSGRRLGWFAAVYLLAGLPAAGAIDGEKLNAQTVKITVDFVDSGPVVGSGVVLCQVDNIAYILTARHVIHGPLNGPRKRANAVLIEFYRNQAPAVSGALLSFKPRYSQQKDIALLRVEVGANPLDAIAVGRSEKVKALDVVYTTGHSAAKARDWLAQDGHVNSAGELILHSANLEAGYSGGPLVDADGVLIGMNTQLDTAGGMATVGALPIDEVLATIKEWMDLALIRRDGERPSPGPAGPEAAPGTRQALAARFEQIRNNSRARADDYTRWLRDAAAALRVESGAGDLRDTLELVTTEVGMIISESGASLDRTNLNDSLEYFLEDWESWENGGGMAPAVFTRPANDSGPSLADQIEGTFALANYTDLTGSYGPLLVQGQLTITKTGGNAVALSLSTQAPLIGLYVNMDVAAVYDGVNLTGRVTQTNLANQGAPWAARITRNGANMTWSFANGEVWVWTEN